MKTHHYIFLFIVIITFLSCRDKQRETITQLVQEWQGKKIQFPEAIQFTRYATDPIDFQIPDSSYKVLVYIDSIGCTSCKLQLPKWKEFIKQVDSISNQNIPFLFFFHPRDYKEILSILKRDRFDYPVCIDRKDELNKLNRFPSTGMFQTFLLDKNDKVCVIGNPIHNLAVQDLYLKQIQGYIQKHPLADTQLSVTKTEYDLGIIPLHAIKEISIDIENRGENAFYIRGITTSCDCTEAFYNWKQIPKNETNTVVVRYKAEQQGDFLRTITLYGNIPDKSLTLTFIGSVK